MFLDFMASTAGRMARIVAGLALIVVGALLGGAGWLIAAVGVVPLVAGALDVCLLAGLMHEPFRGADLRSRAAH
jgi:hypothetical protein